MASCSSKSSKSFHRCCFTGCGRTKHSFPNLHFFRFPTNRPTICNEWVTNCANESLISLSSKTLYSRKVCEKHFTHDCFTSDMRKCLKKDAIPTVLQCIDDVSLDPSTSTQSLYSSQNMLRESNLENTNYSLAFEQQIQRVEAMDFNEAHEPRQFLKQTPPKKRKPHVQTELFKPESSGQPLPQDSPKTPTTPQYKKFRNIKERKCTPRKNITPTKRKLISKLNSSQKTKKRLQQRVRRFANIKRVMSKEDLRQGMATYLPPAVVKFFNMQLNHANRPKKQWSEEERRIALSMSYNSPRFYEQMRRDGYVLPCKSTIARWLQELDLKPGICQDLLNVIKTKVDCMSVWEKNAVLMFDEMQIKTSLEYDSKRDLVEGVPDLGQLGRNRSSGTKVLLFMARGLINRWKIPLAYFIVNDSVKSDSISQIITMCVTALHTVGLNLKTVVCDQSSINRGAAKKLGVTKEKPFFFSQEKKVYWMYDFPHIIKCIRNNLMKKSKDGKYVGRIKTESGVADWTHVTTLYNLDKASNTARATKLTDKHVNPNSFEKMSVKLATQIFSHRVSTAIKTAVEMKQLPSEANETADLLIKVNNIFDSMNSKNKFDPNPYKCAISDSDNDHLAKSLLTIQNGIKFVSSWEMVDSKRRPPSFDGMEHSMRTTLLLWKDLKTEGVTYLLTGRLNQDPLENEFSIARQRCGYNRNPTARMFRQNLRHRLKGALLKPPSGANCEPDEDDLISPTSSSSQCRPGSPSTSSTNFNIEEEDFNSEETEESDVNEFEDFQTSLPTRISENRQSLEACAVRYFAGYAARACLKRMKCNSCLEDLVVQAPTHSAPDEALIKNRLYITAAGEVCDGLICPTETTTDVAHITLQVFDKLFLKKLHVVGIKKQIQLKAKQCVYKQQRDWLKCGTECYEHRIFFIGKLLTAKLKVKLQEISKEIRQPGGKYAGFYQKIKILGNR